MAYLLTQIPIRQLDDNGNPVPGAKLYTYVSGTTTPKASYTDASGATPLPNPVVADANGFWPQVWIDSTSYRLEARKTDGLTVLWGPLDNIKAAESAAATSADAAISAAVVIERARAPYVSVVGDGVNDSAAALVLANGDGRPIAITGSPLIVGSPVTITSPIVDTTKQIFATSAQVTIANGLPVRPEWWGSGDNAFVRAYNALPAAGGEILAERIYNVTEFVYGFGGAGVYVSKPNVIIRGAKMPILSSDCKSLTGGSIIRGMFLGYADNLELRDIGVDYGYTVLQERNGGVAASGVTEALLCTFPDEASMLAGALKRGLRLHNVIGLCASPTTPAHGVLMEGYSDVTCTGEVVGVYSINAVVIKAQVVKAEQLTGYMAGTSEVIIKSASGTTARALEVQIGSIYADHAGPNGWVPYTVPSSSVGASLKFHAEGASIDRVQIASASLVGASTNVLWQSDGAFDISNVKFGQLTTDNASLGAMTFALNSAAKINRCSVADWTARNAPFAVNFDWVNTGTVYSLFEVGHLYAVGMTYAAICTANNPYIAIGTITTENCNAVWRILGSPRIQVGNLQRGTTATLYSTADSGQQPTFGTGWGQLAGTVSPFGADFMGGGVALRGQITPGSTNVCATLPPPWRPVSDKQFMAQGRNGSTVTAVPVTVGVNGNVTVNAVAGGTTNVTTHLSLDGITYNLVS